MMINLPARKKGEGGGVDRGGAPVQGGGVHVQAAGAWGDSLYQELLQILYDGALITDLTGQIVDVNIRAVDFFQYEKNEICRLNMAQVVSGADESLLKTILKNLEEMRFTHIEGYCMRKDGSLFPTDIVVNRLRHAEQDRLCFFIRDITRRRQAEENLRRSEARNRALLSSIPDLIFRVTMEGVILDSNAAFGTKWKKLIEGDATGRNVADVLPQIVARLTEALVEADRTGEAQVFEHPLAVSGETFYFEVRALADEDAGFLIVLHDITARKRVEQAEKERTEKDLEVARAIQRVLLPSVFPRILDVDISATNVPAQKVGGDYYDLIQLSPTRWGLAIADVSGKGVSGALVMAMCRSNLRLIAAGGDSPAVVMKKLNRVIKPDMQDDMFISMIYGILDTQIKTFSFCRVGHEPLFLYHRSLDKLEMLSPRGMALGIDGGPAFDALIEEKQLAMRAGDVLIFFTDGITEARNKDGREFGRERLSAVVRGSAQLPSADMTAGILDEVNLFAGREPQSDDMTLLVLRIG
ncbi:MAG: SpoIIE family protein phosphatase [Verrucomicrobiae bacterium]|nr:SpoIIE family protein phosphatase [Verrucomicrobiae bacterium]